MILLLFRKYGNPPFNIALIHGGPGAAGSMTPVATELSEKSGIIEPIQTEFSIEGQIQELFLILLKVSKNLFQLLSKNLNLYWLRSVDMSLGMRNMQRKIFTKYWLES